MILGIKDFSSRAIDNAVQNYSPTFRAILLDENVGISEIGTIEGVESYTDDSL